MSSPLSNDGRRLYEYFIVAGLTDSADELAPIAHDSVGSVSESVAPITDICIIFPGMGESIPEGYECVETTPSGHPADLNHGSIRSHSAFLCFRRGYHKPPLVDLGILDEGKGEKAMTDATIIDRTPFGHSANVNNTSNGLYFTTRRSQPNAAPHQLVITHVCVILINKGETPPHTFYKIDKNLNKGMVGSDVYVCYKKAQTRNKRIAYKADILDCFPPIENINESLAQNVPMFCLPLGASIECWADTCSEAERLFSTCVLTDEKGTKYYGASLTFFEKYPKPLTEVQLEALERSNATEHESQRAANDSTIGMTYYGNKSICIVSRYPFFESYRRFLYFIYSLSTSGPQKLPIERYISHLMHEVPFPSPSRPRVLVQFGCDMISFESHDDSQIPLSGATFVDSLRNLGPENFVYAMLLALLEQKILVHSLRPWLLTSVSETICALMFPFHWQCPYIPQCPLALAGVLHAPLPFIAGVDSRYFDYYEEPPHDVTCFDLDTATVSHSSMRGSLKLSLLPKKPLKRLKASLEAISKQISEDAKVSRKNSDVSQLVDAEQHLQLRRVTWEFAIREAFLRFMCSLMAGYANHLRPILKSPREANATDTGALFNLESFLQSRDKNSFEFYKRFSETQCFIRFIEERSFISDKNAYNVFFDDCITKVMREKMLKTEYRLLDFDTISSTHTVVVPPPEIADEALERNYSYDLFPEKFEQKLFEIERIAALKQAKIPQHVSSPEIGKLRYWAIRTKQEIRTSLTEAANFNEKNVLCWPRTLLFYAYSLWFLQLPSLLSISRNKTKMLRLAFKVLSRMERCNIPFHDQVCYRILMHLCGEYNRPALAVQVLRKMRRAGISLNAVTYGIYHRTLMEGDWPSDTRLNAIEAWDRIRLRIEVCTLFRERGRLARELRDRYTVAFSNSVQTSDPTHTVRSELDTSSLNLQALNISNSNNSLCSSDPEGNKSVDFQNDELDGTKTSLTVFPLDSPKTDIPQINFDMDQKYATDPLNVTSANHSMRSKDGNLSSPNVFLSPSRQIFMQQHSTLPFSEEKETMSDRKDSLRKKGMKLGSSWIKGITNSSLGKFMRSQTTDNLDSANKDDISEKSGMSFSPSLSSIVHQVRKNAVKGINSLVNEAMTLNKSTFALDSSTLSTISTNDGNANVYPCSQQEYSDAIFQLDSGTSGDILGAEYWMREILPQDIAEIKKLWISAPQDTFIDVTISSCSPCPNCNLVIYDEELMAGWTVDDSNLNSTCPHCNHSFVPSLRISINERKMDMNSSWYVPLSISVSGQTDEGAERIETHENFALPFVSPLVLRRELESLLVNDVLELTHVSLKISNPVVFWNFVYYCRRLDLPSHILTWIAPHVHIRCVFDVPDLHSSPKKPIYFAKSESQFSGAASFALPPGPVSLSPWWET
ncbi:DENN (AEX-3) domain-containing protein [Ditylenchus destructor]|nr:DENN (AEX-3) domain-containing protein [Ditylenchus destructor]